MQNSDLFLSFLVIWSIYVLFVHWYAHEHRLGQVLAALSHSMPTLVACCMSTNPVAERNSEHPRTVCRRS